MTEKTSSGRTTLVLIALTFFGPMALAMWLYFSGQSVELGANHGELLSPVENLRDTVAGSAVLQGERLWRVVYVNEAECGEECRNALYKQRQTWKMLGREMERVGIVYLHGGLTPDADYLQKEHPDLSVLSDNALSARLAARKPETVASGGYYLIDPNGNLVLYFQPDIEPNDLVSDMKRLLKISQIG